MPTGDASTSDGAAPRQASLENLLLIVPGFSAPFEEGTQLPDSVVMKISLGVLQPLSCQRSYDHTQDQLGPLFTTHRGLFGPTVPDNSHRQVGIQGVDSQENGGRPNLSLRGWMDGHTRLAATPKKKSHAWGDGVTILHRHPVEPTGLLLCFPTVRRRF